MRINTFNHVKSYSMRNVVNMLNQKNKSVNNSSSLDIILAQIPQSAKKQDNSASVYETSDIRNTMISLQGGTDTQKIQARCDTSYYTKRYSRTDDEVLNDIRNSQSDTVSFGTKKVANSKNLLFPEYTDEEIFKITAEKFGERLGKNDYSMSLEKMASKSDLATDFFREMAYEIEYTTNPGNRELLSPTVKTKSFSKAAQYELDENGNVISANIDESLQQLSSESLVNIDCKIDDLAALYAFYTDKINSEYSGEEYNKMIAQTDEMFKYKLFELGDLMCKGYKTDSSETGTVGTATVSSGIANSMVCSNDEDGVRLSMTELFEKRSAEYINLISSDSFNTGVENTENEWPKNNAEFMVHKLHQQIGTSISDIQTDKYTSSDLKSFAMMQLQYTVKGDKNSNDILWGTYNTMNEEAIGAYIGMIGIQTKQLTNSSKITGYAKELLNTSFNNYIGKALEYANEQMKSFSKYLQAKNGFSSLNTDRIMQNINTVMNAYNNSSNIQSSLQSVFNDLSYRTLKTMAKQFQNSTVDCRYENTHSALRYLDQFSSDFYITKFNLFEKFIGNNNSVSSVQKLDMYT